MAGLTTISGFQLDAEGHWVAELACGHRQHVRHRPPWENRGWTQSAEGRREKLGTTIDCAACALGGAAPDSTGG